MFQTGKATFVANLKEEVVEITQLSLGKTVKFNPFILLSLLRHNFADGSKKSTRFCSKGKIQISYGFKKHLYSNIVNTYLCNGLDKQLEQYIIDNFKSTEETSKILLVNQTNPKVNLDKYLIEFTSSELLELYHKRIAYEAMMSDEERLWCM